MTSKFQDFVIETEFVNELVNRIPIACGVFDAKGTLVSCNENWLVFFCMNKTGNPLNDFPEFLPTVQPCGTGTLVYLQKKLERAAERGFSKFELEILSADKTELHVDMYCKPLREGFYVACATVASQKAIEAETMRLAAEEESKAKTRFLARMSHEIRTPMNAVMGITEVQLSKGGHPPETAEAFARIYNSSNMLISIINDILDFSKVEAGKMDIIRAPYDVASLLVDTVQLNLMHIGSRPIKFDLNVDPMLPVSLEGDQLRIRQVMNNLLSNAFKYTDEGSVSLDVWFKPHSSNRDLIKFFIRVKDTGQGMTSEQINDIFKLEFTRFNVQHNRVIEGTGLGMNISKQLIRLMGGTINVESRVGAGSSFTVTLPQKKVGTACLGPETVENLQNFDTTERALKRINQLKYTPMPYGKVLVVDDVESNLYVAKGLLMPYRLTIETADSGFEAIQKVKDGNIYDIIFMDHMMPGMSGVEAVKALREMDYDGAILALTANSIVGQSEMYLANGFSGFISKPIDINQLNANLLRFIRDKQSQEVIDAAGHEYLLGKGHEAEPQPGMGYIHDQSEQGEISRRVFESFLRDAARAKESIEAVLENIEANPENLKIFVIHLHALKSALGNVGEFTLSHIAASLEQAGRDVDFGTITHLTPGFLSRLDLAREQVSRKVSLLAISGEKASSSAESKEESGNMETIFAVDDSDTNLVLVEEALEEHYSIITMPSAERMFKLLERITPRLVLLDIEMPGMNGFQALEILRSKPEFSGIPVAFMTATVTPEIQERSIELRALGVIAKPFGALALLEKVDSWLRREGKEVTILIVDDTPMIIAALTRILSPHYKIKAAKDGEAGLKIARENEVDLILLDISMPNMNGFDVIERLKSSSQTAEIPVIFITGSTEAEDEVTGFSLGAVDYIKKPFTKESVLHRVRLYLDGGDS